MTLHIAISKASGGLKYANYPRWITAQDPSVQITDLSASSNPEADLQNAHGLLLTGGPDVEPGRYGQPESAALCNDIDLQRDDLELRLIGQALDLKIPILGICRGFQVLNVYFGGTLLPDIPTAMPGNTVHPKEGDHDRVHSVEIEPGSLLFKATGLLNGTVNSAHHQALDRVAEGMTVTARSLDGIAEALEWRDPASKPYLLGVQWHPERMTDQDQNPLSSHIRQQFLFEATCKSIAG